MAPSMGLFSFFKYCIFTGRYTQCACKLAQCVFCCLQTGTVCVLLLANLHSGCPAACKLAQCVSCCLQSGTLCVLLLAHDTVRPPCCSNNLCGSVGENQKFLTDMLLPSSGSAAWQVASQRGVCRYMRVQQHRFGSESHAGRQGRVLAGKKNKASWNYFRMYSLLKLLSISQMVWRRMVGLLMNAELVKMWKETVVA